MATRKGDESIVQEENCFVEEIKEVELRSRRVGNLCITELTIQLV